MTDIITLLKQKLLEIINNETFEQYIGKFSSLITSVKSSDREFLLNLSFTANIILVVIVVMLLTIANTQRSTEPDSNKFIESKLSSSEQEDKSSDEEEVETPIKPRRRRSTRRLSIEKRSKTVSKTPTLKKARKKRQTKRTVSLSSQSSPTRYNLRKRKPNKYL